MRFPIYLRRLLLIIVAACISQTSFAQYSSCWALHFDGNDIDWQGYYIPNVRKVVKVADGFVVGGSIGEAIYPSRDGDTIGRVAFGGPFIAKYDFDGNLQWLDYGKDEYYGYNGAISEVYDIDVDPNGNIYFSGVFPNTDSFFYNNGQSSATIAAGLNGKVGVMVKLDPAGQVLWHSQINGAPFQISYSPNGKLVSYGTYGPYTTYYMVEGDWMNAVEIDEYPFLSPDIYSFIFWIDTANGHLLNYTDFRQTDANVGHPVDMTVDAESNVIFTGQVEYEMCLYTPGRTDSMIIGDYTIQYEWPRMVTVKFDSTGVPLWHVTDLRLYPGNGGFAGGSYSFDVKTAPDGTIYLNGYEYLQYPNATTYFFNPDSSVVTFKRRENNLIALTKDGYFKWTATGGFETIVDMIADSNSITVLGTSGGSWTSNVGITDTTFSGGNTGVYLHIPNENPEMILIKFDTAGQIIHGVKLGDVGSDAYLTMGGFTRGNDSSLLIYTDGQAWLPYTWYDDTLQLNEVDGMVLKTTPGVCSGFMYPYDPAKVPTVSAAAGFSLYPNPSASAFIIRGDWQHIASIEIRNMLGMTVYREEVKSTGWDSKKIVLPESLAAGNYIIRLTGPDKNISLKLTIAK